MQSLGISGEYSREITGTRKMGDASFAASYNISFYSLFSYYAAFDLGYLIKKNEGYVQGVAGLGLYKTFFDIGVLQTVGGKRLGMLTGLSTDISLSPDFLLKLYIRYKFDIPRETVREDALYGGIRVGYTF